MKPWHCALCATKNRSTDAPVQREGMKCRSCASTWRVRSSVVSLLHAVGAPLAPLTELEPDWSRHGIGCSDHIALAVALTARFDYVNTYYHRFPRVDLLDPPVDLHQQLHFIVCSDVLEHVPGDPIPALKGLHGMLNEYGSVALSVPMAPEGDTREFYPDMASWSTRDDFTIDWTDHAGGVHHDSTPEYHGGPGQTLAFRLWSRPGIEASLRTAGFRHVVEPPFAPHLGVPPLQHHGMLLAYR